jgi:hypothetical protein
MILRYFGESFKVSSGTGGCQSCDYCTDKNRVIAQLEQLELLNTRKNNPDFYGAGVDASDLKTTFGAAGNVGGSNGKRTTSVIPSNSGGGGSSFVSGSSLMAKKQQSAPVYDMTGGYFAGADDGSQFRKASTLEDRRWNEFQQRSRTLSDTEQWKLMEKMERQDEARKKPSSLASMLMGGAGKKRKFEADDDIV